MTRHKVPFYFVLYLIAVCSGFMAVEERDKLEARIAREYSLIDSNFAEIYSKSLTLSVPDTNRWTLPDVTTLERAKVFMSVDGLWTPKERNDIEYKITNDSIRKITNDTSRWTWKLKPDSVTGSATFLFPVAREGIFTFKAVCYVHRDVPNWFPAPLLQSLKAMVYGKIHKDSTVYSQERQFEVFVNAGFVKPPTGKEQ